MLLFHLHPMSSMVGFSASWWKVFLLIAEELDWIIFKGSFQLKPFQDSCKEARGKGKKGWFRASSAMGPATSCRAAGFKKIHKLYIYIYKSSIDLQYGSVGSRKRRAWMSLTISKQQFQFAVGVKKKRTKI